MAEYLAPGVYVEETSFRAKSIEGVATATAGFVGQCRSGPWQGTPMLVTSFAEFERHFGSLEDLELGGGRTTNYLAHAVLLFFANGGKRVYISRIVSGAGEASGDVLIPAPVNVGFQARFPGLAGNVRVLVTVKRVGLANANGRVEGLLIGDVVELTNDDRDFGPIDQGSDETRKHLNLDELYFAEPDPRGQRLVVTDRGGSVVVEVGNRTAYKITMSVLIFVADSDAPEFAYEKLSAHPASNQFIGKVLRHENPAAGVAPPADRSALVFLRIGELPQDPSLRRDFAVLLLSELLDPQHADQRLGGGSDGGPCTPGDFSGGGTADTATGLAALEEVDDIAIVAAPGAAALADPLHQQAVRNRLVTHCNNLKYRFAVLSADRNLDIAGIRDARSQHDSKYAALYYPWLVVVNPFNAGGRDTLFLPPDGAISGIYARSDVERGVHKAPANEVVRNVLGFSRTVSKGHQDVLNPEGINCLRFFEGRGYRVWGARTISSDPEWQYVNVRRLFIYLEHSIDRSTQWAVFEPNNERLWLKIRLTIESFLYDVWRTGALMGSSPDQAFFVRCDRTTMSQGDLDNGRLVCLIGVAPTKPAEFVIFRIGQWTAEASII